MEFPPPPAMLTHLACCKCVMFVIVHVTVEIKIQHEHTASVSSSGYSEVLNIIQSDV